MDKKHIEKRRVQALSQLKMHPVTARSRLVSDLLFDMLTKLKIVCHRCGGAMTRTDYSIEHKTPWLHAKNAAKLYFDLNNIGFSHKFCNQSAARKPLRRDKIKHGHYDNYCRGRKNAGYKTTLRCRCDICREAWNAYKRSRYTSKSRHARYKRTGN